MDCVLLYYFYGSIIFNSYNKKELITCDIEVFKLILGYFCLHTWYSSSVLPKKN